ncbi:MAG: hypothetical protein KJ638_03390, partial [Chloroflexi bacterium]|nr:hypothetical protein [Chloroflexota bacterium]
AAWQERVPTSAPSATYDFQIVVGWSADQGATWERSVVDRLESASASNAFYAYPAIETDGNGLVYVVWLYSPDSQVATSSILFAVSPDDGENWTEPRVANNPTGQQAADVGFAPALVSDASGQVVIAWTDYRETSGDQIYAAGYPADRYLPNGTYYSPIFDTGCPADWNNIAWTETVPVNTSIVLSTRIWDNTAAAWSSWSTHTTSGEALSHPDSNQIQYRAVFSSNGFVTPVLNSVTISYTEQYCIFLPLVQR